MSFNIDIYGEAPNPNVPKGTSLIDFSSLAISGAMAYSRMEKVATVPEGMIRHLILNSILKVRKRFKAEYPELVIACDSRDYWRKDVFPHYKFGRSKKRADDNMFDWDSFFVSFAKIKNEIREVFPYKVIEVPKCEADDVIGILAMKLNHPILINAKDDDYNQSLKRQNVKLYAPKTEEFADRNGAERRFLEKLCRGDSGDGIAGIFSVQNSFVDGIRQKPATQKKIDEFLEAYHAGTNKDTPEFKRFIQNEELMSFEKIPANYVDDILRAYEVPPVNPDNKMMVFNYLTSKELAQIGGNFAQNAAFFC